MTIDEMTDANEWLSQYFSFINPENQRDLDSILSHIRMEVLRRGIKAFVIDPWNCIADEKPSHMAGTDWINKALFTIKMFAQETGTHGFIVAHPTKLKPAKTGEPEPRPTLTDISGSVNFRNQADYGIVVHRDQGSVYARDIVEISIAKIRMQETGEAGASAEFRYNRLNARIEPL
jgi:twinkle protein